MSNLFYQLGGHSAVDAVVETFYRKVLIDKRINKFFDGIDMEAQLLKQKAFLTMVFGGPAAYSGKDMREAHSRLVTQGLNDRHVDAVIEHLGDSLREHNATEQQIASVTTIANSVRDDVLNRDENK